MENTGHDNRGRFTAGNREQCKNPYTKKAAEFRKALYDACSVNNFKAICQRMVQDAYEGGYREREALFSRLLGAPTMGLDLLERLERIEAILNEKEDKPDE